MSHENVEIIQAFLEALVRRDRDAMRAVIQQYLAPEFEYEAFLTGATYKGADGLWEFLDDIQDTVGYLPEVEEAIDLDEHVLIVLRMSGRGSRSRVPVAQQVAVLMTFDGNMILSGKGFPSKAEALEAARLRE